ncbi:MAG: ubiquinone biosynthesis hydroxylase [Hyphomicrobiales bacterium]|nr:ubiquinone biosynthesis hydroxylase [Hyphomicrobiales bacterium]
MTKEQFDSDILIVGGGYVGLSIALATKTAAPHLSICVLDGAPASAIEHETRASAIAAAACRMLDQLDVWQELSGDAQPINEMIVTDSRLSDVVRPVFLTFPATDENEPFAHMIPNRSLITALRMKAAENNVELHQDTIVTSQQIDSNSASVTTASGIQYKAKLLIAADGVRSRLRQAVGIKTMHWSYDQTGIVTTLAHERPHNGCAQEHFLPAGPFAILPLKGNRSSLVWTEPTRNAERILAMEDFDFELELEQRFGHKLGKIKVEGARKGFPLGLTLAREFVRHRFALAGDAAHGIHPISGQGLNLGFMDAAALSQTIVEADRLGLDIGTLTVLENYQMWRRFDTVRMGVVTDVLNRLFANDNPIIRAARDFGLSVVDRLPGLKTRMITQAAGLSQSTPNLLQGKAI